MFQVNPIVDEFSVPLWKSIRAMNQDPQTIVIVPSMNVDAGLNSVRQQALEERFLFLLLLLRQPRARVIYVTSQQIHPDVLDYYLDLLPGVFAGHARKRHGGARAARRHHRAEGWRRYERHREHGCGDAPTDDRHRLSLA